MDSRQVNDVLTEPSVSLFFSNHIMIVSDIDAFTEYKLQNKNFNSKLTLVKLKYFAAHK